MRTRFPLPLPLLALLLLVLGSGPAPAARAEEPMLTDDPVPAKDPDAEALERKKADLVLRLRIHRAIDRGAAWLASQQRPDGAFHLETNPNGGIWPGARHEFGETMLGLLTLAHCGYGPDRREIRRALAYARKRWRGRLTGAFHPQASTYSLCIFVLALRELYATPPNASTAKTNDRYGARGTRTRNPCGFPAWARKIVKQVLDWVLAHQSEKGLFRYPEGLPDQPGAPAGPPAPGFTRRGPEFAGPEDLSNTQYALLALWVGSRCGYDVDPANLKRIARRLLAWQEAQGPAVPRRPDAPIPEAAGDGSRYAPGRRETPEPPTDHARGFGYTPGDPPTSSMTAAGLSSLVTVKGMLLEKNALDAELRKRLDRGIWDGIAWLTHNFTITQNHPVGHVWHYYYLYGLERALVIADKRTLGEHDWYKLGAKLLVDAQQASGRWDPPGLWAGGPPMPGAPRYSQSLIDSCFALLFLKRATIRPRKPILGGPVVTPARKSPAAGAGGR